MRRLDLVLFWKCKIASYTTRFTIVLLVCCKLQFIHFMWIHNFNLLHFIFYYTTERNTVDKTSYSETSRAEKVAVLVKKCEWRRNLNREHKVRISNFFTLFNKFKKDAFMFIVQITKFKQKKNNFLILTEINFMCIYLPQLAELLCLSQRAFEVYLKENCLC